MGVNISTMRIDIITVLPEMLEGFVHESILARAQKKGLAEIHLHNLRDYSTDKWRRVDDYLLRRLRRDGDAVRAD